MEKSKIFYCGSLFFIGGIFFNSFIFNHYGSFAYFLPWLIISFLLFLIFKKEALLLLFLFSAFFMLGIWRHGSDYRKINDNHLNDYIQEKEVTLIGIVDSQPLIGEKTTKLVFKPQGLEERILITKWKYPQYQYGDQLKIKGLVEKPQSFNDFNYQEYLAKDKIYGQTFFPNIELITENSGSFLIEKLFSINHNLRNVINKTLPVPQSGLMEALLFGQEDNIPQSWKDKFNLTGTRHIAAVSGMNITIISFLALNLFLYFGLWRHQAFYFSLVLIAAYVLTIGAPSSAIRAGVMAIIFLTAQYLGRISNAERAVVMSAAIMLFVNPLILKSDIGFQLSFLAIMGLIYLQPFFLNVFKKVPDFFELRFSLASSLSAQAFVLPILIYNFGQVSLISPLANILIVPLLSLITILGFVLGFLGLICFPLAYLLSFFVWPFLTFILKVVDFSSRIPYASFTVNNVSIIWVLISYILLFLFVKRLKEKEKIIF